MKGQELKQVSSHSNAHDVCDFDCSEAERSDFIFLFPSRGLWAARALPNDLCWMERTPKSFLY